MGNKKKKGGKPNTKGGSPGTVYKPDAWEKEIIGSIHCMSLHEYNNQHNLLWSQH